MKVLSAGTFTGKKTFYIFQTGTESLAHSEQAGIHLSIHRLILTKIFWIWIGPAMSWHLNNFVACLSGILVTLFVATSAHTADPYAAMMRDVERMYQENMDYLDQVHRENYALCQAGDHRACCAVSKHDCLSSHRHDACAFFESKCSRHASPNPQGIGRVNPTLCRRWAEAQQDCIAMQSRMTSAAGMAMNCGQWSSLLDKCY